MMRNFRGAMSILTTADLFPAFARKGFVAPQNIESFGIPFIAQPAIFGVRDGGVYVAYWVNAARLGLVRPGLEKFFGLLLCFVPGEDGIV